MVAPGDMFWTVSQGCKVARNECRFDCIPDFPGKENASVTRRRKPHLLAFAQTDQSFTITPVCSDSGRLLPPLSGLSHMGNGVSCPRMDLQHGLGNAVDTALGYSVLSQ